MKEGRGERTRSLCPIGLWVVEGEDGDGDGDGDGHGDGDVGISSRGEGGEDGFVPGRGDCTLNLCVYMCS